MMIAQFAHVACSWSDALKKPSSLRGKSELFSPFLESSTYRLTKQKNLSGEASSISPRRLLSSAVDLKFTTID